MQEQTKPSQVILYAGCCGKCGKPGPKRLPAIHHYRLKFGVVCSECAAGDPVVMPPYDDHEDKPPFWIEQESIFTPDYLDYLARWLHVEPSLPGGFFVGVGLDTYFPRFGPGSPFYVSEADKLAIQADKLKGKVRQDDGGRKGSSKRKSRRKPKRTPPRKTR